MNFTEYYSNKMTEALDKKEGEMWRDFYTTILPRRIKKFKKKYAGTPESLEKAVQEYEDELVGDRREYIDFSLSEEYDRLLKLHFHDAVERLDRQQGDTPDKTEHPVLDSQPLASELIADLKSKLQIAEADRDNFYNQKSVFQMQLDIISFVLRIADPIMLKEIYADTKSSSITLKSGLQSLRKKGQKIVQSNDMKRFCQQYYNLL